VVFNTSESEPPLFGRELGFAPLLLRKEKATKSLETLANGFVVAVEGLRVFVERNNSSRADKCAEGSTTPQQQEGDLRVRKFLHCFE
jgi:hypothetical protein